MGGRDGAPGTQKLEHRGEEEERKAGADGDSDCPQEGDTALTILDHHKRREEPLKPLAVCASPPEIPRWHPLEVSTP